ncbi:DUF4829 domain-containing protein [Psychroflexus montanilacus]|uniref:DUF4829 domain-containing protein n=1 Tax=Psychroflexus montanilacus TaxID=2873598 RepID=UPI001CCC8903|nr:DUF4829 domain-containing protein [Psychroflexus montanilacus]MBZ9650741.1 DUF4829 domain-containing protein [Psychroflexus montanilacus]
MKIILLPFILCLAFMSSKAQTPSEVVDLFFTALNSKDIALLESLSTEDLQIHTLNIKNDNTLSKQTLSEFSNGLKSIPENDTIQEKIRSKESIESEHLSQYTLAYSFYVNDELTHSGTNVLTLINTEKGWKISYIADTRE